MSNLLHQVTAARKYYIKQVISKKITQKLAAQLLGVTPLTLRKWQLRYCQFGEAALLPRKPGPKSGASAHNKTSDETEEQLVVIANKHPFTGPVDLADMLHAKHAVRLNPSTVYRILQRRKVRYGRNHKQEKRRKLKLYSHDRVGRELQLDAAFPFGYQRKECIYSIIDDCSRFVFSRLMPRHNEANSIAFVKLFLQRFPFQVEAIRTDCGREFSRTFSDFLGKQNIIHNKNRPYCPEHNGKVERYNRTRKESCMLPFHGTIDHCNYLLQQWEYHYNCLRPHSGLGMDRLTPVQKMVYSLVSEAVEKKETQLLQQYRV